MPQVKSAGAAAQAAPLKVGIVGLGRMGGGIARRLMRHGLACVAHDVDPKAVAQLAQDGAVPAESMDALLQALDQRPAIVWLMLPAGAITEEAVARLGERLRPGDIVVDGGNTFYKDDIRRARLLRERGIHYVDVGTSGGVWGLERGYCMMIGGEAEAVARLEPLFEALAPGGGIPGSPGRENHDPRAEHGYVHVGGNGAGHFVKMIHNGIEYGLMQAYAEGFDILRSRGSGQLPAEERYDFDLADIAEVWRHGSVISSWLLDLGAAALAADPKLGKFTGYVEDSGEGRWTVNAALEQAVPAEVLSAALFARFRSRTEHTFAEKMLSAMRLGFGGHRESHADSG
jgi:6-phosphogluconate dehydrogenase